MPVFPPYCYSSPSKVEPPQQRFCCCLCVQARSGCGIVLVGVTTRELTVGRTICYVVVTRQFNLVCASRPAAPVADKTAVIAHPGAAAAACGLPRYCINGTKRVLYRSERSYTNAYIYVYTRVMGGVMCVRGGGKNVVGGIEREALGRVHNIIILSSSLFL